MQLEKPKLFPERREFFWVMAFLLGLIMVRLLISYQGYQDFISKPFYYTYAKVLVAYEKEKNGKRYQVLKLQSEEGLTFYTTTYFKKDLNHHRLRLQIFPSSEIHFRGYLGTFYIKSKIKKQEKLPKTFKDTLLAKVASQHSEKYLQSFYNAIFFATTIDYTLRQQIALLGVSHLVALSGFHLGILWGLVYGLLLFLYTPLQQKFFPYRHALFDVGSVAMVLLGVYVWFVGFPPSLVRSFAMVFVGWGILLLGMELLSFTFLTTIVLLLGVLFPSLLISLSFWLSVAGVFYIFLLLHYTKRWSAKLISLIVIPFGIFILMLPVVHSIFAVTSLYQLTSPFLSLLFVPFYPLVMLLHLVGYGGLLDGVLMALFALPQESHTSLLPLWIFVPYLILSLGAIVSKKIFYGLLLSALFYFFYLYVFA